MQIFQAPLWLLNGSLLDGASHPALHTIHRNIDLKKTQKSQKNIFSLILLVHSSFVSCGKNRARFLQCLPCCWNCCRSYGSFHCQQMCWLPELGRYIIYHAYHICMTFSGMLLLALKDSDLLVKETVPQGKQVPKNYFLLLKR